MKYIAKPLLFNNIRSKTFDTLIEAVLYLNHELSDIGVDSKYDYVFCAPSVHEKHINSTIQQYIDIGKLIIEE
jgi:hypothetical protein